ncbi:MAG: alcohol dehydrogenase catalytic domain-containing protein [Chloroflexota bacterium]
MKQIWITKAGRPEVLRLQDAPDPIPRSGELRIRVEAAGSICRHCGAHGGVSGCARHPYVPGYEVAGVVDALGWGVPDLQEGDKVFAATLWRYSDNLCAGQAGVQAIGVDECYGCSGAAGELFNSVHDAGGHGIGTAG